MKNIIVKKLFFCPIKSLSFNESKSFKIISNLGIENDRCIAFTRGLDKNLAEQFNESKTRNLNSFLTLKNSPFLKKYNFLFDSKNKIIRLYADKKEIINCNIENRDHIIKIEKFIENLDRKIKKPIHLIYNKEFPYFDTTPEASVSMINLNTIRDLENKIKKKINFERFRGNILIDNLNAWQEFEYINKMINIGEVQFKVDSKIPRCATTNINPNNYNLDINLPNTLIKKYGHKDFGVYLIPKNSGFIKVNDKIF